MKLIIPGEPTAKARPRMTRQGIAYTPTKTKNVEVLVQKLFIQSKQDKLNGEIEASIQTYFSIPKSTSKKNAELMRRGLIRPTKKPDLDNVAKLYLDALNKLAYDDDSQVVELTILKFYDDNPRVEITLSEV